MPLSRLQRRIFRLLAAHRDPESFVAGSRPVVRHGARSAKDVHMIHGREHRVAVADDIGGAMLERYAGPPR